MCVCVCEAYTSRVHCHQWWLGWLSLHQRYRCLGWGWDCKRCLRRQKRSPPVDLPASQTAPWFCRRSWLNQAWWHQLGRRRLQLYGKIKEQNNPLQSRFLKQLQIGCNPCQRSYWRWTVSCQPAGPLLWWRESRTSVLSSGLSAWCGQTPPRTKGPSRWPACPPAHACPSSPSSCCCWPLPRWSRRAAMEGSRFVWGKLTHWQEVSLYIASCIGFD